MHSIYCTSLLVSLLLSVQQQLHASTMQSNLPTSSNQSSTDKQKNANNKNELVIYDPKSGQHIEPALYLPIKLGTKRQPLRATGNLIELPQLWNPCSCSDFQCICCLGLRFGDSFNHRVCASLEFIPASMSVQMRIMHNQRTIVNLIFSARNPPPLCLPVLLPLPLFGCLRLYNIRAYAGNLQICLSFVLRFLMNQLFELQFDCVRFGVSGVQFVNAMQFDLQESSNEMEFYGGSGSWTNGQLGNNAVANNNDYVKRQNIKLEENYSGISVESDDEINDYNDNTNNEGFFRKGRVRKTSTLWFG